MPEQDQIQQPPNKTKILYEAVSKKYDIGSYDEFNKKLQDPSKRKAFYNGVGKEYDLGSYDQFEQKVSPSIKKKEATDSSLSPSDSTPIPKTGQSVDTSDSEVQKGKQIEKNYKNNSLTGEDVHDASNGPADTRDWFKITGDQFAVGINNKGKNLSKASSAPIVVNILKATSSLKEVQNKINDLEALKESAYRMGDQEKFDKQMEPLIGQRDIIRSSIQKSYNAQKDKILPELVNDLKENFAGANWNEIYDNTKKNADGISAPVSIDSPLKWDSKTHKITPKSAEWVIKNVDNFMNKKGDDVINAQVSGDLDKKERTYPDISKSVIDYLNTVPVRKEQEKFREDYIKKNPEIKEAFTANQRANEYFSKENVDSLKATINTNRDKDFMKTGQKYYGPDGIFNSNKDYTAITDKYAQLVHEEKMPDDIARKQIMAEVQKNPALKKINDNYENEVRKINEHTQTQYQNYIIQGFKKGNPDLTVYKDGTIGVSSLSEDQYKNMMEGYEEGLNKVAVDMIGEQDAAAMKQSNEKAKKYGAFLGSMASSSNDLVSAFSKFIFNKTQWGGDNVRHFEAQEISAPNINESQVAAAWNWKGVESLKDPNFWMSKIGAMVPVIAGAAAVTAATEGEGVPAYVSWLTNAGLFTAQGGLETYNQLLNTRDAQGNMLTESDASHFMAQDMERSILPNVLMMAATSGTLLKAKNIVKPSLSGAAVKGLTGAAIAQPFFTWQGYESYANMKEAQGEKTDIWDYMQSKDFKDNLINGMVIGGGLSLLHAPGNYIKSVDNWTKMVHTSEGEFRNLIPQNYALQQEMSGNGNYLRDALKLHIFNVDPEGLNEAGKKQLSDLKNQLLYSVNLDRNIESANLDRTNVNDLYQAHNLALADQHDFMAEQNKGNKSLSSIYSDKAKEYREQAKAVANGEAKFHYLTNDQQEPIFMSDKSFKVLDKNGTISKWMIDQTIEGAHSNSDPEFAQRYKDHVLAKNEAIVEGRSAEDHGLSLIEENKDKLGVYYEVAKGKPQAFYKDISDQVYGRNADGSVSLRPDAEIEARTQYGDDIVDLAKVMYPLEEKAESATSKKEGVIEGEEKTTPKASEGEYKPTIRDDYFAQSDFFTPEEKEKFSKLSESEQDKMIDEKRAELKASPEDNIPVSEVVGKPVTYKGKKGMLLQDGQSLIFKEGKTNKEYEIGNVNELGDKSAKGLGIETEKSVVDTDPEGNLTVRGKPYINPFEVRGQDPTDAILYDKEGNVVNVRMKTPDGERRTFTGPVAEDLAYQIHLKEISKNNEQPALEEFINSDEPTRKEIENGGLAEPTEEKPTGNIEKIPGKPVETTEPIKSDKNETEKTKEAERVQEGDGLKTSEGAESDQTVSGAAPPPPVIGPSEEGLHPRDNEWTSIQKKDLSERVQKENAFTQTNRETVDNVVNRLSRDASANGRTWQSQAEFEVSTLHNDFFNEDGSIKQAFNPTTDQLALIGIRLMDINGESSIKDFNPNDEQQTARNAYLENEKMKAERLLSFGEAGRAFQFRQSLLKMGINGDIQIKRKSISSLVGVKIPENEEQFNQLSDFDKQKVKPIYDAFQSWKSEYEKENKVRNTIDEKYSQIEFDKRIKSEVDKALKEAKVSEKGAKITKDSSKKVADSLKNFADKLEKFGRGDLPEGTQKAGLAPDIQKKIADAIRWIADKIENGDIKIPELIAEAIDRFKGEDLSEADLSGPIKKGLSEAGIEDKSLNAPTNREGIIGKMKEVAQNSGVKYITKEMADKGLVRDYLHDIAGRGETDPKDILDRGVKELGKAFPGIDQKTLRDAYLKEGSFAADKSKELEDQIKSSTQTFRDITVLQRDIEALETGKTLYGSDKEQKAKIISDYEKQLRDEKDQLIKKRDRAAKEIKDAKRKADKIAEYDKRIKDVENHQKVWDKAKKGKEVDKDLSGKREELRKVLIKNGVKLELGSKDARQTKEKVIQSHNDRVDNLKGKISDLLNDANIPDEDKKVLRSIKDALDKMNVKVDAGDLSEKINKSIALVNRLHTENITNLVTGRKSEIFKDLKNLGTQLKKDNNSGLQDIQLQQLKDKEVSKREKAERQLASGNFEDVPKLSDYKKDEELLKLSRDRKVAETNLSFQVEKYKKQNQSFWQRQLTRLQRLQRANLISGIMTNGKVLVATVVKPVSDALVRRTIGTITAPIFKSLGLKGQREALNNDATIKSFVDSFKGMTLKKAAEIRGRVNTQLENATISFQAANDQLKALETQHGKGSSEYDQYKDDAFTKSKNDYQAAQYDWAASAMYDFISPRAWHDRWNILKTGVSSFEEGIVGPKGSGWADEKSKHAIGTIINKALYSLEIFGRIHGAEKDISARQAFVEGFLKRSSERIKNGEQLTPSALEGIALESYPNFLGGKFQNKNPVSDAIRSAEKKGAEGGSLGKAFSFWLQSVTPVLKVPLNIEAEGLFKYTVGVPVAIGKTFYEIGKALKANDLTIKDGIKDFNGTMDAVREHMKGLSPEKRDRIIEYANKGIFGAAIALVTGSMAASGNLIFGGAYGKGQKKRKYLDEDTGEMEELNYGEVVLNGHKLGKFWSAVILHLPPLMPAVMSATYVQKYKDERGDLMNEKDKGTAAFDGLSEVVRTAWEESALKSLGDVAESPGNIFNSFTTQMAGKNISEYYDTDDSGNLIERKPANVWEQILYRTGGRGFVPTKEEYDINKLERAQEGYERASERRESDSFYDKNKK